jgi:UDP-galactopyranose mutase
MQKASASPSGDRASSSDLLCFSHLRWDFVYQRPQHLLSRFARERRVFYWEEPMYDTGEAWLDVSPREDGLTVVVPHLPWRDQQANDAAQRALLDAFMHEHGIGAHVAWFYTPMALGFAGHLSPLATVYDCMDELSAFLFAPPELLAHEAELLRRADLVFTGGPSLYEAKHGRHPSVHLFPSSIDTAHFGRARTMDPAAEPADQAGIPHPRIGFFGVLDERFDPALVRDLAAARPDWQLVLIGPVAKIDEAELPRAANIHYLGPKSYAELPDYLAGWDVAALFFAVNASTRFISPTKTPEYLAAGRPVVSTPIVDVERTWARDAMVRIAGDADAWVRAVEALLAMDAEERASWLERVDGALARSSWEQTYQEMRALLAGAAGGGGWNASAEGAEHESGLAAAAGD